MVTRMSCAKRTISSTSAHPEGLNHEPLTGRAMKICVMPFNRANSTSVSATSTPLQQSCFDMQVSWEIQVFFDCVTMSRLYIAFARAHIARNGETFRVEIVGNALTSPHQHCCVGFSRDVNQ
jgi:hypothetical protein